MTPLKKSKVPDKPGPHLSTEDGELSNQPLQDSDTPPERTEAHWTTQVSATLQTSRDMTDKEAAADKKKPAEKVTRTLATTTEKKV